MKYDFGGYATKFGIKCTDGRTIRPGAFDEDDGKTIPILWQHMHDSIDNVLGHGLLEKRNDGMYIYGLFNETEDGLRAKALVEHGDIRSISIFANRLKQRGGDVLHGSIKEVSLVLAGANSGATIDSLSIEHSMEDSDDEEAIIMSDSEIDLSPSLEHEDEDGRKLSDIYDSMTEEQKDFVCSLITSLSSETAEHSDEEEDTIQHSGGNGVMKKNVFDQNNSGNSKDEGMTLSHDQFNEIVEDAIKCGSFRQSFLSHVQSYGIENIDYLFPDAKTLTPTPDMISRDMAWVTVFLNGARHSPFSRIKSIAADITADEARAKGYVKGNLKKEEVIKLLKRVTTPTTVYKKQKLDKDDISDITDFNVVAWLKAEMRLMLNEELARAGLVGDGRDAEDDDKINEENIRPIWTDNDMYAHHVTLESTATVEDFADSILRERSNYKGTGNPILFTTESNLTDLLLMKDKIGRRYYSTVNELASALRVSRIVPVEVMEGLSRTLSDDSTKVDLVAIMVNPSDYTYGADKGGKVSMFDDFDIDYNQYKYLIETRTSGTLTKPKSALVFEKKKS